MKIESVQFVKGLVGDDLIMDNGIPQIAFIGRSNVGKSSLINALTKSAISRTSSIPGKTAEINFFLVNNSVYFVDLPGYGFARTSFDKRNELANLIDSYLFNTVYTQKKVVMIININTAMTDKDVAMFHDLQQAHKHIVIALSKIDKITQKDSHANIQEIKKITGDLPLFKVSAKRGVGIDELLVEILS